MSVICDMLVYSSSDVSDAIAAVNADLVQRDSARHQQFNRVDMEAAGGRKVFCGYVWAAAFNHLAPNEVHEALAAAPWDYPAEVYVITDAYDYGEPPYVRSIADLRRGDDD